MCVGERGLAFDCAGLSIDAIVEDRQYAFFQCSLPVGIKRRHWNLPFGERLLHRLEVLLRKREGYVDRLQLRDNHYSARFTRSNEIACIDQPYPGSPGNRG